MSKFRCDHGCGADATLLVSSRTHVLRLCAACAKQQTASRRRFLAVHLVREAREREERAVTAHVTALRADYLAHLARDRADRAAAKRERRRQQDPQGQHVPQARCFGRLVVPGAACSYPGWEHAHRCPHCNEWCVCAEFYDGARCQHATSFGCATGAPS